MVKFSDLNEQQKQAVIDDANHLRIIAGNGTILTEIDGSVQEVELHEGESLKVETGNEAQNSRNFRKPHLRTRRVGDFGYAGRRRAEHRGVRRGTGVHRPGRRMVRG